MEENYKNRLIDNSKYSIVDIKKLTDAEIKDAGYVFAPFICVEHTEESIKQYDKFMEEYRKQHECCPKCGATEHTTTLIGYVLNLDKKENYRDMNSCICMSCGHKHLIHDRISPLTQ